MTQQNTKADDIARRGTLERYQEPNSQLPYGANIYRLPDMSLWAIEHYPDKTVVTRIN